MGSSSSQATIRARIAAYTLHSKYDAKKTTAKARATFLRTFEQQVDPDGQLPEEERQRRAAAARKAHFARLALKSARARQRSIGASKGGAR